MTMHNTDIIGRPTGKLRLIFQNVKTGKKRIYNHKNIVTDAARVAIAARLQGQDTGVITYCAVGTGTNTPAYGDTKLQTEIERKQIALASRNGGSVTYESFFNSSEANGTLKEAGLFGDLATDDADTGTLFCRTAIDRVKSTSDTLTIQWTVTI